MMNKPTVGDTLFVSLYDDWEPRLITVIGYHHDERGSSEQIDCIWNGKSQSYNLKFATFYPDVDTSIDKIYLVTLTQWWYGDDPESESDWCRLKWFFNEADALAYLHDIEQTGKVSIDDKLCRDSYEVKIEVENV